MIAARKMTKRQVLVRKIDAVETLGCVSVLCSDKTGTLTAGEMALTDLVPLPDFAHPETPGASRDRATEMLMECGLLNNAADPHNNTGSPTEVAIMVGMKEIFDKAASAQKRQALDVEAFRNARQEVFEVPFNSENKWALSVHKMSSASGSGEGVATFRLILKGAPERVVPFCLNAEAEAGPAEEKCAELMSFGRRVLGFAMRDVELPENFTFKGSCPQDANFPFEDLHFVGLVGLEDPPKHGIEDAIRAIKRAGVRPVMVTGDHPTTAQAIAERIGIADEGDENSCITGCQMQKMLPANGESFDDAADSLAVQEFWREVVQHTTIFARVSPSHKQTIVSAYQHYGQNIVAMTGDGVNDAPALKQAEVGVAMGIRGTEVAKEAADIVLLDDDLQSVVAGIEQGRLCSENLRKSILYTLCSKVPQAIPTFAELLGVPTALTVAQVLLIDIGTDIWTAIAFAWQPAESALMSVPPRDPRKERMVTPGVLAYSYGYIGMLQMALCFFVFFHAVPEMWTMFEHGTFLHVKDFSAADRDHNYRGMTSYYWTLVLAQVAAAMATTTTKESLFAYGLPNLMLNLCLVAEIAFALVIIYWTPAEQTFKTRGLTYQQMLWGAVGFLVIFIIEEIRKFVLGLREKEALAKSKVTRRNSREEQQELLQAFEP
jgi:magnesium-transporting ATPase (P-type)